MKFGTHIRSQVLQKSRHRATNQVKQYVYILYMFVCSHHHSPGTTRWPEPGFHPSLLGANNFAL